MVLAVAGIESDTPLLYTYNSLSSPPFVGAVSPLSGPAAGGTTVTLLGEAFGFLAAVSFAERDASGTLTGRRQECAWRDVPSMSCNNTVIQCLSPALVSAGVSFDVMVSTLRASAVYSVARWRYDGPVINAVAPSELPPQPRSDTNITVSGRNFGGLPGNVTVGPRTLACSVWTDGVVVCMAPPGVAAANVTVTTASGLASAVAGSRTLLSYFPPSLTSVDPEVGVSSTLGGGVLRVTGLDFGHPLPMSLWLVRRYSLPAPPWNLNRSTVDVDSVAAVNVLGCVLSLDSVIPPALACVVPSGSGVGWGLMVVNHDVSVEMPSSPAAWSSQRWRHSALAPNFTLSYSAPELVKVQVVAGHGAGAAPALGGFSLLLSGSNFGASAPEVTVGALPCAVVPGTHDHGTLVCSAPPRQMDGDSNVRVTVDGQTSGTVPFAYDPPVVLRVEPAEVLALAPTGRPRILLYGVNFGTLYRAGLASPHVISVGPLPCVRVVWTSDVQLSCVPEGETTSGPMLVSLRVGGDTATPVTVVAGCPEGWHAQEGQRCAPCPPGARCTGGMAGPVSLPGHFPLSLTEFVQCMPRAACAGGVSGATLASRTNHDTAGCSMLYRGDRCADCAVGAYRLRGRCAKCPDTAWLLFLGFALAVIAAAAAAVYLSGKRINMAGLSIGVVSARAWLGKGLGCPEIGFKDALCTRLSFESRPPLRSVPHALTCSWLLLTSCWCRLLVGSLLLRLVGPGLYTSSVHVCGIWI